MASVGSSLLHSISHLAQLTQGIPVFSGGCILEAMIFSEGKKRNTEGKSFYLLMQRGIIQVHIQVYNLQQLKFTMCHPCREVLYVNNLL